MAEIAANPAAILWGPRVGAEIFEKELNQLLGCCAV